MMMAGQTASGKTHTTAEFVQHTLQSIFPAGQVGICCSNLVGCGPCMEPALISAPGLLSLLSRCTLCLADTLVVINQKPIYEQPVYEQHHGAFTM